MCDPVTIALAVGGAVVGAGGEIYKGYAGQRANKLNADIARMNADTLVRQADIEKQLAELPILKGAAETAKLERTGERIVGAQYAGFQSAGFDPTVGSPALVQAQTISQVKVDMGLIKAQAELEHASALAKVGRTVATAASQYGSAAGYKDRATDAVIAGYIGAAASILKAGGTAWSGLSSAPSGGEVNPGVAGGGYLGTGGEIFPGPGTYSFGIA